jgi:hypothetical protein
LAGPFRPQWIQSDDDELVKLVKGTGTLTPVHTSTSTPTYYNRVVKEKWTPSSLLRPGSSRSLLDDVDRRVRGTAGGDRLPSSCPPSTDVASLTAVNIALNSVVSDNAFFGTADLTDFTLALPSLSLSPNANSFESTLTLTPLQSLPVSLSSLLSALPATAGVSSSSALIRPCMV